MEILETNKASVGMYLTINGNVEFIDTCVQMTNCH
jgi:hypothetical protein